MKYFLTIFFYIFLIQGGITVCNLQCNMVNLNNNHILHLYISFREAAYFGFSEKVRLLSRPDGPPRGIGTNPKSPCPRNKIFKLDQIRSLPSLVPQPTCCFFSSQMGTLSNHYLALSVRPSLLVLNFAFIVGFVVTLNFCKVRVVTCIRQN